MTAAGLEPKRLSVRHLAKWLSVHLRTKWLGVRVPLQSLKLQVSRQDVSSKEFLDIQANTEEGITLKCVRDMIRTYSQTIKLT